MMGAQKGYEGKGNIFHCLGVWK